MISQEDVNKLVFIRTNLSQIPPENRNILTDDMQWLADKLTETWTAILMQSQMKH